MKKSKEVLFGFFILLALAVIFIPIFSFNQDPLTYHPKDLPRLDFFKEKPVALNEPDTLSALKLARIDKNAPGEKLDSDFQVSGFAIQVGAFTLSQDARKLVKKLQEAGYPAFVSRMNAADGISKVLVGPQLQKEDAVKLKAILDVKFNLKGNVIHYVPTDIMKESAQ